MIGIITVFYSENFGSVLQAYALRRVLQAEGYESQFLSTRNRLSSHSLKKLLFSTGNQLLHGSFRNLRFAIKRYQNIDRVVKTFPYVRMTTQSIRKYSTIIVGSDTVWDVDSPYFMASKDVFWATIVPGSQLVAYAPSVANSTAEKMKRLQYPIETICKIRSLSARDQYSFQVLRSITDKHIEMVCDPTILLGAEGYTEFSKEVGHQNYIAVYVFEQPSIEEIEVLRRYARQTKKKLISIGKVIKWCDISVEPSIENFISYYKSADFVITNTFHGTVFSLIFEKNFVCLGYKKKKITELLDALNLSKQVVRNTNEIESVCNTIINYTEVNANISDLREKSLEYIRKNVQ